MTRVRYWKLSLDDLEKGNYDEKKVLHWELKCQRDEEAKFGVFCYRNGTPWDYDLVKGLVFYHLELGSGDVDSIAQFLKDKFGGQRKDKGSRVFLENSTEIYAAKDLVKLGRELGDKFEASVEATVELENFGTEEQQNSNFPTSKLLLIPGKH